MQHNNMIGKRQAATLTSAILIALLGAVSTANANTGYTFTDNPITGPSNLAFFSAIGNAALVINNSGVIAGQYQSTASTNVGFVNNASVVYGTTAHGLAINILGIDSAGDIVGNYHPTAGSYSSFYATPSSYSASTPTQNIGNDTNLHGSSSPGSAVAGITDTNLVVGTTSLANSSTYIFEYNTINKTFTDLNLPVDTTASGYSVTATGVSTDGTYISGNYTDQNSVQYGFVYDTISNVFTTINNPDTTPNSSVYATGVNKLGEVVGYYSDGTTGAAYGYTFDAVSGTFINNQISDPSGVGTTMLGGINDHGVIVGQDGNITLFTATANTSAVPLPGAAWLMTGALLGWMRLVRRRA